MLSSQMETRPDYLSYLLRLRCAHSGDGTVWRVSLEVPLTEEVFHFEDLPSLFAYLLAQTGHEVEGDNFDRVVPPAIAR